MPDPDFTVKLTLRTVVNKVDILLADPQVGNVKPFGICTVDKMFMVTNHCPLLKPGSPGTFESHAAPVAVAQMVDL